MDTSYTNHLEVDLWKFAYSVDKTHESDEYYEIIDFLNASSSFRSFGNGLLSVIQKKYKKYMRGEFFYEEVYYCNYGYTMCFF